MKVWWLVILSFLMCQPVIAKEVLPPFEGLVEPKELVDFSSDIPGVLEEVKVERGAWVKKGQVLARLKSGVNKALVGVAQARVEFAKRKLVRNEQLYKKKLISINDKDELETEIQLAELELVEAKERLDLRTIRSTINGVVVERLGSPGEYVGEEPFITVAQINPLIVELVVPDQYFGAIKVGEIAEVQIYEPVEANSSAKVIVVDRVIDAATSTFGVRLELPNPKLKLPAGVKCQVVF